MNNDIEKFPLWSAPGGTIYNVKKIASVGPVVSGYLSPDMKNIRHRFEVKGNIGGETGSSASDVFFYKTEHEAKCGHMDLLIKMGQHI